MSATAGNLNFNGNITLGGSQSYNALVTGTLYNGGQILASTVTLASTAAGTGISLTGDFGKINSNGDNLVLNTSAGNGPINLNISIGPK